MEQGLRQQGLKAKDKGISRQDTFKDMKYKQRTQMGQNINKKQSEI